MGQLGLGTPAVLEHVFKGSAVQDPHAPTPPPVLLQVSALKNLGLNIRKAKVVSEPGRKVNTFFITDAETSEKVVRSARLEEIRMTIINNMLYFHPVRCSFTRHLRRLWAQPLERQHCKAGPAAPYPCSCSSSSAYLHQAALYLQQGWEWPLGSCSCTSTCTSLLTGSPTAPTSLPSPTA
jgi:hypothetical protein